MLTIPENLIIPLALAMLGTLIGSYLTAVLKLYLWIPPKGINWVTGILIYVTLVRFKLMPFGILTAGMYTICILGGQAAYDKYLRSVWAHVNKWHEKRGRG